MSVGLSFETLYVLLNEHENKGGDVAHERDIPLIRTPLYILTLPIIPRTSATINQ